MPFPWPVPNQGSEVVYPYVDLYGPPWLNWMHNRRCHFRIKPCSPTGAQWSKILGTYGDIVYGKVSPRPAGDISFIIFHLVSIYLNNTTCFVMVLSTIFCGLKTGNLDQYPRCTSCLRPGVAVCFTPCP